MTWLACLALLAFQNETPPALPEDPWERSEWQLVSDPSIFGEPDSWTRVYVGPEPTRVPPILARDWIFAPRELCDAFAGPLARWFLDPDAAPPQLAKVGAEKKGDWIAAAPELRPAPIFAFTTLECAAEEVRLARMPGVEWLLLNGELYVGDPDRHGFGGVPALLKAGTNRLFVKARDAKFELSFEKPASRLVLETQDVRWPGESGPPDVWDDRISFPVFNVASTPVTYLHHHYGKPTMWNSTCRPEVSEWIDGYAIRPLGLYRGWHFYWNFDSACDSSSGKEPRDVWLPQCLYDNGDTIPERKVLRRPVDAKRRVPNNVMNVQHMTEPARLPFAATMRCGILMQGTQRRASAYDGLARFHQQSDWYHSGNISGRCDDVEYPKELHGNGPRMSSKGPTLAIFGNSDTVKHWKRFVPKERTFAARDGAVEIDGVEYTGDDLAGWAVVRSPERLVRIYFDSGSRGARLALLLAATWTGEVPETALFRADPTSPRGWYRLGVKSGR